VAGALHPDQRKGETIKSFVVLRPGATATEQDILEHCQRQLAAYKVPRRIEFVPELPKSSMMKILRRDLREREIARMKGTGPPSTESSTSPPTARSSAPSSRFR